MSAELIDPQALQQALAAEAPCGPDLEYDPAFQALEAAAAGTPERQYGDKIFPAEPPDWLGVHEHAAALAQRTRDVRVAVWLTRAGARLHGMEGAARGLELLQALLEQHWPHLHPALDASDGGDPTMRLNALAALTDREGLLADLRAAALVPVRGSLTLRQLELGLERDSPAADEAVPTRAGLAKGLAELAKTQPQPPLAATLRAAAAAAAIARTVHSQVGLRAPDAEPLARLLGSGTEAQALLEGTAGADGSTANIQTAAHSRQAPAGAGLEGAGLLATRDDALNALERVCQWLEQHEPASPAPLLIRRAQRLMKMSFVEIIRDMAPGGLDQVETIAGRSAEVS